LRTEDQKTRLNTLRSSRAKDRLWTGAHIRYYGKNHPENHISVEEFKGSHWIKKNELAALLHFSKFATKDRSKWSKESNFEPALPPMSRINRIARLDQFIEKLRLKGRSENNLGRLKQYLNQAIAWHHGWKIQWWNTTPEYRFRWQRHFEWIISSPDLYDAKPSPKKGDFCVVVPEKIKLAEYIAVFEDSEPSEIVYEHNFSENSILKVVVEKEKPIMQLEADCSCGEIHKMTKGIKSPNSPERSYKKEVDDYKYKYMLEKEKNPSITEYVVPKLGNHTKRGYKSHDKEEWVVVHTQRKIRTICRVTEQNVKQVWNNRYNSLKVEECVGDALPHYLSPCKKDIDAIYTQDKDKKDLTKGEKNIRKRMTKRRKGDPFYRIKKEDRCAHARYLPSKGVNLECHKYKRTLVTPDRTIGSVLESKGITPLKAAEILNWKYCKPQRTKNWVLDEPKRDYTLMQETIYKGDLNVKPCVNFTKREMHAVLNMFECSDLHYHDTFVS
jgi:hypothetical protein